VSIALIAVQLEVPSSSLVPDASHLAAMDTSQ